MARWQREESTEVFRFVITSEDGHQTCYGPYAKRGNAVAQMRRELRWRTGWTGRLQRAETVWKDAE